MLTPNVILFSSVKSLLTTVNHFLFGEIKILIFWHKFHMNKNKLGTAMFLLEKTSSSVDMNTAIATAASLTTAITLTQITHTFRQAACSVLPKGHRIENLTVTTRLTPTNMFIYNWWGIVSLSMHHCLPLECLILQYPEGGQIKFHSTNRTKLDA